MRVRILDTRQREQPLELASPGLRVVVDLTYTRPEPVTLARGMLLSASTTNAGSFTYTGWPVLCMRNSSLAP